MGTYERKVNQLKDLMRRKYKSAYNKSKEMDIDISSMTYLPCPDAFNVINIEKMHVILDRVNKIIDENKDKLKNPTCATCVHLHDREWAKRYGKVCCSIWQVCDHYINPNRKYDREQKTYTRRPSNKACPNYEYGDDNFENRKRCLKNGPVRTNKDRTCVCCGDTVPAGSSRMMPRNAKSSYCLCISCFKNGNLLVEILN